MTNPKLLKEHISKMAESNPERFIWLICGECSGVHHAGVSLPANVEMFAKSLSSLSCPNCNADSSKQRMFNSNEAKSLMRPQSEPVPSDNIEKWLTVGQVGLSSKCMALTALGRQVETNYPYDPGDLNRCLLLLEMAPEVRKAFPIIRQLCKQWEVLIDNWEKIETLFLQEAGINFSHGAAPKTYELMKSVLATAPDKRWKDFGNGVSIRVGQ